MIKTTVHLSVFLLLVASSLSAQTNPVITKWLQNTTIKGRHYVAGNSTPIQDAFLANVRRQVFVTRAAPVVRELLRQ